jgi:hypothetical protein
VHIVKREVRKYLDLSTDDTTIADSSRYRHHSGRVLGFFEIPRSMALRPIGARAGRYERGALACEASLMRASDEILPSLTTVKSW